MRLHRSASPITPEVPSRYSIEKGWNSCSSSNQLLILELFTVCFFSTPALAAYGSDRKESMGRAEVTMKHRELGTKKAMIERNMLVEEWEYAYEQDEWLTNRFPKMKDLKSNDGDAASQPS